MGKQSYAEKLRDPRWQKKRLEILERDGWKCVECGATDKTLNVHHGYYARDKDPWDYLDCTLATLCDECHDERHGELAHAHAMLARMRTAEIRAANTAASLVWWSRDAGLAGPVLDWLRETDGAGRPPDGLRILARIIDERARAADPHWECPPFEGT